MNKGFRLQGISNRVSQYDLKIKSVKPKKRKNGKPYTGGKWNVYDNQIKDVLDKKRGYQQCWNR
jgi:hypothetical protein